MPKWIVIAQWVKAVVIHSEFEQEGSPECGTFSKACATFRRSFAQKMRSGSEVSPHNFIGYIECLFNSKLNQLEGICSLSLKGYPVAISV